jgi:hypothetical protein
MQPVTATFQTADDATFPAGTVADAFVVTLTEKTSLANLQAKVPYAAVAPVGGFVATFADVPAGTYLVSCAVVDATGAALRPAVTDDTELVVAVAGMVTIAVPSAVKAALG